MFYNMFVFILLISLNNLYSSSQVTHGGQKAKKNKTQSAAGNAATPQPSGILKGVIVDYFKKNKIQSASSSPARDQAGEILKGVTVIDDYFSQKANKNKIQSAAGNAAGAQTSGGIGSLKIIDDYFSSNKQPKTKKSQSAASNLAVRAASP